jgi:hypothetical protein
MTAAATPSPAAAQIAASPREGKVDQYPTQRSLLITHLIPSGRDWHGTPDRDRVFAIVYD